MEFDVTDEQAALVDSLRTLLARRADGTGVRRAMASPQGYDPELWQILCEEIGAAALAIPEDFGGVGFTAFETHLVLEELGYSLAPSPYLGSVAIAAQAILAAGDEDAAGRLLPGVADGSRLAALAWADARGRWAPEQVDVVATPGEPWRLSGTTPLVLEGTRAEVLVAIARTPDGPGLFELLDSAEVARVATPAVDPTLRIATLRFEEAAARPLGDGRLGDERLDDILDRALTAITAVQVGAAARGLDMTVEYAKQRMQFGRLIGSFQALKHRMADMHVALEAARTASRAAAWAVANGAEERSRLAALAKARCSDALSAIAGETIQLHGGIAITWEHDAHLVFKRAHATAQLFGTADEQRRRVERSLGLVRG